MIESTVLMGWESLGFPGPVLSHPHMLAYVAQYEVDSKTTNPTACTPQSREKSFPRRYKCERNRERHQACRNPFSSYDYIFIISLSPGILGVSDEMSDEG